MKKITAFLISLGLFVSFSGCGNSGKQTEPNGTEEAYAAELTDDENVSETKEAPKADSDTAEVETEEAVPAPEVQESKVLVAYFSATNTTEKIAEHIANGLNADIYEIIPKTPYTDADLNYNDNSSRTTIEMNDPSCRPAISVSVENMGQYDIVFIGYPIWWGDAPRIVSTFMESYDFSGKTIVPFCTSGGSGIGSSTENLEELISGAEWLPGKRLNGGDSQDTVMEWVNGLKLELE